MSSIKYPISEVNNIIDEKYLRQEGFSLANVVGSLRLEQEFDLSVLSMDLENTEYHPDTYSSMIYRPFEERSVSVLTPSSGRLAIAGAKSKRELNDAVDQFLTALSGLGIEINKTSDDILIQNMIATYDFGREFDLSILAISIDLNDIEYEPEQFPGIIYQSCGGNSTILIFTSGKVVVAGSNTYLEIIQARDELHERLKGIDI